MRSLQKLQNSLLSKRPDRVGFSWDGCVHLHVFKAPLSVRRMANNLIFIIRPLRQKRPQQQQPDNKRRFYLFVCLLLCACITNGTLAAIEKDKKQSSLSRRKPCKWKHQVYTYKSGILCRRSHY